MKGDRQIQKMERHQITQFYHFINPRCLEQCTTRNCWMGGWIHGCMDGWVDEWMHGGMDAWMHRCMDAWMDGWMHACMGGWMHGWMDEWIDGWMDAWMCGCMDAWMHGWLNGQVSFTVAPDSSPVRIIECQGQVGDDYFVHQSGLKFPS